jgi:DNA-binding IclR family transcriptional regulator
MAILHISEIIVYIMKIHPPTSQAPRAFGRNRMSDPRKPQQGIQSLELGLALFHNLHRLQRPATLTELAKLSTMPPSKAHRYCVSLIRAGFVQQDGRGLYSLGPLCSELGRTESDRDKARRLALAALPGLVRETGETAFLSAWGQTGPRVLHVEESARPFSVRPTSRGDMPLHNSATGRAFAAYLDPAELDRLLELEFSALRQELELTGAELAERRRAFFRHLADVRKRGLARTTGERFPGIHSFSAPVFDRDGKVILAISCHGLAATFPSAWNGAVAKALRATVADLMLRTGGKAPAWPPPRSKQRAFTPIPRSPPAARHGSTARSPIG